MLARVNLPFRLAQRSPSLAKLRARQKPHSCQRSGRSVVRAQAAPSNRSSSAGRNNGPKNSGRNNALVVDAPLAAPEEPENLSKQKQKLRMRIDGDWYDVTGWAKAHPSGARFIEFMDGKDATDAFYALHSYGPNGARFFYEIHPA
eukprot:1183483-Prorocentrum_minimum.AAC.8